LINLRRRFRSTCGGGFDQLAAAVSVNLRRRFWSTCGGGFGQLAAAVLVNLRRLIWSTCGGDLITDWEETTTPFM
jgi:hypothetical protein